MLQGRRADLKVTPFTLCLTRLTFRRTIHTRKVRLRVRRQAQVASPKRAASLPLRVLTELAVFATVPGAVATGTFGIAAGFRFVHTF